MSIVISTGMFMSERGEYKGLCHALSLISEYGFNAVELDFRAAEKGSGELACENWKKNICEIGELAAKKGIAIMSVHTPSDPLLWHTAGVRKSEEDRDVYLEYLRRSLEAAGMLLAKNAVFHAQTDNIRAELSRAQNIATNIEFFTPYLEIAERHNISILIENLFEYDRKNVLHRFTSTVDEQIALVDALGGSVGACWSFGHGRLMYKDQISAVKRLGNRLKAIYINENDGAYDTHLLPFTGGDMNWREIMSTVREMGFEGCITLDADGFFENMPDTLRTDGGALTRSVVECLLGYYINTGK